MEERLLALLESILGNSTKKSKNNYAFYSPFVNHHKKKLEIDITLNSKGENLWHCWISDEKGRSINSLFKRIGVSKSKWDEHNNIFKKKYRYQNIEENKSIEVVNLPDEYTPIWKPSNSIVRTHALKYLLRRGVSVQDMIKYSIGYCESGIYENKIIIPSFDENGIINYFVGRSFYKDSQSYKNPPASKDIIGFELFINWDLPLILCEGAFDAIAIKNNAIPLFGKFIQDKLKMKILEKKVSEVYIILDADAIKSSLKIAENFINEGITVHLVDIKDGDPAELGFLKVKELIDKSNDFSWVDLVKYKLQAV
jgi:DNA primase